MALASVALNTARTLLNDDAATLWTDAVLIPKLQEAHRELQVKLQLSGIPVINAVTVVLSVPANTTDLSTVAGYPTNLVKPEQLKERVPGQKDEDFREMTEVDFIPNINRSTPLTCWSWIGEKILLLGSTIATEVQLRYWRGLPAIVDGTSQIGFIFGENYLGHRTAALAASSTGNDSGYKEWTSEAMAKMDEIIRMNVKGLQNLPANRRPYHRGRGKRRVLRDF